ncbi:MAG: hypothetical protein OCD01_19020 [Fibrobacterales bacterium]
MSKNKADNKTENTPTLVNETSNTLVAPEVTITKYEEYYAELLPEILAVPRDSFAIVNMTIDTYLKEAEQLREIVKRNIEPLRARNYKDADTIALTKLTGAARIAQSNMHIDTGSNEVTWKEIAPEAFELRDTLLTEFKYACQKAPKKIEVLKKISKGTNISDMIQDLFDLARLSETILPELEATNFPTALLARTKEISEELGPMQMSAKIDRSNSKESRVIRDQAITLLNTTVVKIRTCAEFVFKKEPKILALFKSEHQRTQYSRTKKSKEEVINTATNTESDIAM